MIFTSVFTLDDGKKYEIAIMGKLIDNEDVLHFKIKEMLGSSSVLNALADQGSVCLITATNDHPIPVAESGCLNFTQIYNALANHLGTDIGMETYEKLAQAVESQLHLGITAEDIKEFKEGCEILRDYLAKPVNFKLDVSLSSLKDISIMDLIKKINSGSHGLSFVSSGLNRTLFMDKPSSKVFIALPKYADVVKDTFDLPSKSEVMPDYSDPQFETPDYKSFATGEDIPLIEGSSSNNKLDIQENEREFYNALREYLEYGIQQQYEKPLEEIDVADLLKSDVYFYLSRLAERILSFGWRHTGLIAEEFEDSSNDETGEDDVETSKSYSIRKAEGTGIFVPGSVKLKGFIETEITKNKYVIAEIIIKLLRWGNRKPNKLVVENGINDLELNTFQIKAAKETYDDGVVEIINGREFTLISEIDATGAFTDTTYLNNLGISLTTMHCPVGIVCARKYLIHNGADSLLQYVYMSLADVVEILETRPNAIEGVTLNSDGTFTVTKPYGEDNYDKFKIPLQYAINRINADKEKENKLYVSDKVIDHALSVQAYTDYLGYLAVMKNYFYNPKTHIDLGRLNYISVEECADKTALGKSIEELVTANIAYHLLPSMLHTIKDCEKILEEEGEVTLEQALNAYMLNIIKYPIDLSLDDVEEKKAPKQEVKTSSAEEKLKRLSLGGNDKPEETNEIGGMIMTLKEQLGKLMYMGVPDDAILQPVKIRQFEGDVKNKQYTGMFEVVGYFAQVKEATGVKYLFTDLTEPKGRKTYDVSNGTVIGDNVKALPLSQIVPILFNDIGRMLQGKESETKIRFTSEQAMIGIINNLNKAKIEL